MNVACPECSTVYRLDPARVPESGVATRCRECSRVFRVDHGAETAPGVVVAGEAFDGGVAAPSAPSAASETGTGEAAPADVGRGEESRVEPAEAGGPGPEPGAVETEPGGVETAAGAVPPEPATVGGGEEVSGPPADGAATARRPATPVFGPQDPDTRAKRLARALVSDIKVYNPDKWQESRDSGTLRKEFRDEILKSWEEYVEQVGEPMAKRTPYFRDALNDILAEGERVF